MPVRYVVGVDGSSPSHGAALWAAKRAAHDGCPVLLVHVAPRGSVDHDGSSEPAIARAAEELLELEAQSVLECDPTLEVSTQLIHGDGVWPLRHLVGPDDLLVLGTHKTGYVHGRVLGSKGVPVASQAPCAVAVIPEVETRFRRGVVAGVDRVDAADIVGRMAAEEAERRGEQLTIIQATESQGLRAMVADGAAVAAASAAAKLRSPDLVVRTRVTHRAPAPALLDAARDAALLVVGAPVTDDAHAPTGDVIHDLLLNINAPTLVAR